MRLPYIPTYAHLFARFSPRTTRCTTHTAFCSEFARGVMLLSHRMYLILSWLSCAHLVLSDSPDGEVLRVGVREHQRGHGGRRHHGKRLAQLDPSQLRSLPKKRQPPRKQGPSEENTRIQGTNTTHTPRLTNSKMASSKKAESFRQPTGTRGGSCVLEVRFCCSQQHNTHPPMAHNAGTYVVWRDN